MSNIATKAGTGAGALLVVSSTVATLASPAPEPTVPPVKYSIASPVATITLTVDGVTGYTTATALPTTTNGSGKGATISITASSGAITAGTLVVDGSGYTVGDRIYPTQTGSDGTAYFVVASVGSPTGIAILQLKDFTVPSQKLAYDDITNTSSPSSGVYVVKEKIVTVLDPGEFSCTGIFLPSDPGVIALQTAFAAGIAQSFQVQLPPIAGQSVSGNVYEFVAFVSENPIPTTINVDKAVTFKVTLTLNSLMTVLTGS